MEFKPRRAPRPPRSLPIHPNSDTQISERSAAEVVACKSAALCTTVHSYVGVSGATEGASEAPSAHPLYNSAVHCLRDAVAKATAEKGQLTLVSCFVEPHTPLSLQSVLILKREPSPEGPNAVFPSRQRVLRLCRRQSFWDPPGTPNSMKNVPENKGAHRCAKKVHMWPPMRAKVCQSDPKVAKMEPNGGPGPSQKWSCTRTALKTAQ